MPSHSCAFLSEVRFLSRPTGASTWRRQSFTSTPPRGTSALDTPYGHVGGATLALAIDGPLASPHADACLRATDLAIPGGAVSNLEVRAKGTPDAVDVDIDAHGEAASKMNGHMHLARDAAGIRVGPARVEAERNGVVLTTTLAELDERVTGVDVRDFDVEGAGEPIRISGSAHAGSFRVRATAPEIDIGQIAQFLQNRRDFLGHASIDGDLTIDRNRADGRIQIDGNVSTTKGFEVALVPEATLGDELWLSLPALRTATIHFGADANARELRFDLALDVDRAAKVVAHGSEIALAGPLFESRSWIEAAGKIDVDASAKLGELLRQSAQPGHRVLPTAGDVHVVANASRLERLALPEAHVDLTLENLAFDVNPPGSVPAPGVASHTSKLEDLRIETKLDVASSGDALHVVADVRDKEGSLVALDASSSASLRTILEAPRRALDTLKAAPAKLHVDVDDRPLATWNAYATSVATATGTSLPGVPLDGKLGMQADVSGTLATPTCST